MKRFESLIGASAALAIVLTFGLACGGLTGSSTTSSDNAAKPGNTANTAEKPTGTAPETTSPKIEKADFTVTAEEYDKEFTKKGAKEEDLKKYANKNIAVTGRVSLISTEKKGTVQPWVTLYAPGVLNGVSCYFDDDNLEQMKLLKMDKIVTVQGLQETLIVAEISPSLRHCVVLEGAK